MNLNRLLSLLIVSALVFGLKAQTVVVSPIPQSIVWGAKAFDNTATFTINGETIADKDAVKLLKSNVNTSASGQIQILIGKKGDAAIQDVDSKIPNKPEAYYLEIKPTKIYVAGADSAGTYYGVQTLLQILASPEVMQAVITDYPLVSERGLVEGFYGNTFSQQDRISQFEFYGKTKMNTYIYGPKDDPYHGFGTKWRDPYPTAQANQMKELIQKAHENKVKFVWAVHPGNDIKWDDNNGDGIIDDFVACKNKFEKMYQLGVRSYAVFFDDIGGIGTDARNQAKMMNYLTTEFVNKKSDVDPLILCPTQYNQAYAGGDYLTVLGSEMDASVRVMWTGKSVVRMIDAETMTWINSRINRKAYIWLNYPVTDYCIDHLLMGPFYGNDNNIDQQLGGFVANPMEYAEASKVALFSVAEYAWNMKKYNANESWLRALRFLMPDNFNAFKVFCENNVDLGTTAHGMRRDNESAPFKAAYDPFMTAYGKANATAEQANALDAEFKKIRNSSTELLATAESPAMIKEIKPWIQVLDLIAQKGEVMVEMYKNLAAGEPELFVNNYLKLDSIDKVKNKIRSRDFAGSIKSPYPKPANEVMVPALTKLLNTLVLDYKSKFNYRLDVFPAQVLENGVYFIKQNGKYLTNVRNSTNPTFVATRDDANPQRQEWKIAIDPETGRYNIMSAEDSRVVNELGNFSTNPYEAAWHTYRIYRLNGKFAIQNSGSAGNNFWTGNGTRISKGTVVEPTSDTFIFDIVPTSNEAFIYPNFDQENTFYVKSNNKYLTNKNIKGSGGTPTFEEFKENDKSISQEWSFPIDKTVNRFKFVSVADNRYVNEYGVFGTNSFYSTWNTYLISEVNGRYSIRNAGEAGTNYWGVYEESSALRLGKSNAALADSYTIEILPARVFSSTHTLTASRASLVVLKNKLQLNCETDVDCLKLFSLNGMLQKYATKVKEISTDGLKSGLYLLTVSYADKLNETLKVAIK